jgi:SAM-dependent methyltransferase
MIVNEEKLNKFVGKVLDELAASYGGVMVSLGHKLGLYKAMANAGPLNPYELARKTGCAERYVREWLNSQAAGRYVIYHPSSGTYELPAEHAVVLAQEDSPYFMPLAWNVPASMWFDEEKALDAFRTGKGIRWDEHHDRLFCGVAAFYRYGYAANLVANWIPALDGVHDKLKEGATVADIGCGYGHSSILMAQAFPNSRFRGFDNHPESIRQARNNAEIARVADRVKFDIADAKDYPLAGFDLICFFDSLHDLGDPIGAAEYARLALGANGTAMLVEPFANDRVEENLNTVGRLYYSASTTLCCAHSLSEEGGLALGAQAGEERLSQVFKKAGFGHFRRALQTPFNLILEARA